MLQATIAPVSNRATWTEQVQVLDEDGEVVDITDAVIVVAVREKSSKVQKLLAQTSDDTIEIDTEQSTFSWEFTVDQMRGLDASKAYEVGCTIQLNGVTQQFFIGTVSVLDGIVP